MTRLTPEDKRGRCDYCWDVVEDGLMVVQLRIPGPGPVSWDRPSDLCANCRFHLFGLWRHPRSPKSTN